MKKKIIILLLLAVLILVGIYLIVVNLLTNIRKSQIGSVDINGQQYKTTGSIPAADASARDKLNQLVLLANKGEIDGNGFKITVDNDGKVKISLNIPYDQSKQAAFKWLQDNGFNLITQSDIVFTNLP